MKRLPFWRPGQQRRIEEEIRTHLAMSAAERAERGQDEAEAARAARRQFGNPLLVQEVTRDMWGWTALDRLWQDTRYAVRLMAKSPAFTAVAVLTLAIGIGANTAIFSLLDKLILQPLFPQIDRLVVVQDVPASQRGRNFTYKMSYPKYRAWKQNTDIFESLGTLYGQGPSLTGMGEPERLMAGMVSSDFLPTLGITPILGREFRPEDEPLAAAPVVLLSHHFWRSHFHANPDVVGRTLRLNDVSFTIIGVLPEHAGLGSSMFHSSSELSFDIFEPLRIDPEIFDASFNALVVIGKLRPGLSQAAAAQAIDARTPAVNAAFGDNTVIQAIPLGTYMTGETRPLLFILLAAVGAVLLITCANTANLLMARSAARQQELVLRLALGAQARRLFRQLLTESLLLAVIGGGLALALLAITRKALVTLLAGRLPNDAAIHIDGRVLLFTFGLSLLTGIAFGVLPAWQGHRKNLREALGGGARTTAGGSRQKVRAALVVAEIACSLALLAAAGLLLRSFTRLMNVEKGYASDHVLTLHFWPGLSYTAEKEVAYLNAIHDQAQHLPGAESVGFSSNLPLGGNMTTGTIQIEGFTGDRDALISGSKILVSGDYFRALRIPLRAGRLFTSVDDSPKAPSVVIIDEEFARRFFPAQNPIGRRLTFGWGGSGTSEIVGVVGAVREASLAAQAQPAVYAPMAQRGSVLIHSLIYMAVRSNGDPLALAQPVKNVILGLNREQIIEHVRSMDDLIGESAANTRSAMWLFGGFAGIAALLAAIGVYGVLSFHVTQRRYEIGTRMALGAHRSDIFRLVLGHAARLIGAGIVLGAAIALASNRALTSLLFGTRPSDPGTLLAVGGVLGAVALLACVVPVFRATRVDPQVVLRSQ